MSGSYEYYSGFTATGDKIRPSNWIERVAILTSTFNNNRLVYNASLVPVIYNGQLCLRINHGLLKQTFPITYHTAIALLKELESNPI